MPNESDPITNRILLALPPATLERLRPALHFMHTARGRVVVDHVDGPAKDLYFVNRGLVSLLKTMKDGRTVEIGAVGVEGITDADSLFGIDNAVLESVVQIPGTVFRVGLDDLLREVERDDRVRRLMQGYARFAHAQIAQTAACNRLHSIEARCSRWLLAAHDSAFSDTFPLTHEYLAMTLGVQRVGVSIAANLLRNAGLIRYTRGQVTIANRPGLEKTACECYGSIQEELAKLFEGAENRSLARAPAASLR